MKSVIDLSIIIPAYREADRIKSSLKTLADYLKQHDYGQVEVLVMTQTDDDTGAAASLEADLFDHFRVVNLGKRAGKGGAVRAGMFEARGRYRMFMDADLATPLHHLDNIYDIMQHEGNVGVAVRDLVKIHKELSRKIVTKIANLVVQILLLPGVKDTQCGFKVFKAEAAREIFGRQTIMTWSFDVEILSIAKFLHYKIDTFEVNDWKDPKGEAAGLVGDSPLKVAIREARDPILIRLNLWLGKYRHPNFGHHEQI